MKEYNGLASNFQANVGNLVSSIHSIVDSIEHCLSLPKSKRSRVGLTSLSHYVSIPIENFAFCTICV